jgi:large subunit ribosomal protein L18
MFSKKNRKEARLKRKYRIRKRVFGTPEKPRLAVFRSEKHIYAQVIDDVHGTTLAAASTLDSEVKDQVKNGGNVAAAQLVGKLIGEKTVAKGISKVVFDRGGYLYHGRIKALADAAREAGLQF